MKPGTVLLALVAVACDAQDGWSPSVDAQADGGPDAPADTGTDEGPDVPVLPVCLETCSTRADCGVGTSPAYDADNYACEGGYCIYSGCLSDDECVESAGEGFGCDASVPVPMCNVRCASSADCGYPTLPAYAPDHYSCDAGYCTYAGCRSDGECVSSVGSGYGCDVSMTPPVCVETCGTASDCGSDTTPAYSPDNYSCVGGYCRYTGCLSDAECVSTLGDGYGCRGL
jgi:hypothetical protein